MGCLRIAQHVQSLQVNFRKREYPFLLNIIKQNQLGDNREQHKDEPGTVLAAGLKVDWAGIGPKAALDLEDDLAARHAAEPFDNDELEIDDSQLLDDNEAAIAGDTGLTSLIRRHK